MEFLSTHIKETIDIADGYITGQLVVLDGTVRLLRNNGEEILLDDRFLIEIRNSEEYQKITIQEALTAKTAEGWPLYAGLYVRVKDGEMDGRGKR